MKVRELVEQLEYFNPDKEVILNINNQVRLLTSIDEFSSLDKPFDLHEGRYLADQVVMLHDQQ